MASSLSVEEARLWRTWKAALETVTARVARDVTAATGLSEPDFGVLSRLVDLGKGELRQQDLAESMGWDKSRLSHHLTRMESRGLVRRRPAGRESRKGVLVGITVAGHKRLTLARPVHARSIRQHLLARVPTRQRSAFYAICRHLVDAERA